MLSVQISSRRKVYVSFTPDTAPNKGGYYCEVFVDEMGKYPSGVSFVIHNYELRSGSTEKDKRLLAYKIGNNRVKEIYR